MGIKQENEITVKIKCEPNELCTILENKGFKVINKFIINDIFMIPNSTKNKMNNLTSREILKEAVLIRDIEEQFGVNMSKKITFKEKKFNTNGDIISQKNINCDIVNVDEAVKLFQAINYCKIMNIVENDIVYVKDDLEIDIKDIQNGDNLIEVETVSSNKELDTIEKIKKQIINLQLPIDTTDFFVKKAEIELDKIIMQK